MRVVTWRMNSVLAGTESPPVPRSAAGRAGLCTSSIVGSELRNGRRGRTGCDRRREELQALVGAKITMPVPSDCSTSSWAATWRARVRRGSPRAPSGRPQNRSPSRRPKGARSSHIGRWPPDHELLAFRLRQAQFPGRAWLSLGGGVDPRSAHHLGRRHIVDLTEGLGTVGDG